VRFGATVTRRDTIVAVNEADAAHGRIAFLARIARVLLGATVGDGATLRTGRREEELRDRHRLRRVTCASRGDALRRSHDDVFA